MRPNSNWAIFFVFTGRPRHNMEMGICSGTNMGEAITTISMIYFFNVTIYRKRIHFPESSRRIEKKTTDEFLVKNTSRSSISFASHLYPIVYIIYIFYLFTYFCTGLKFKSFFFFLLRLSHCGDSRSSNSKMAQNNNGNNKIKKNLEYKIFNLHMELINLLWLMTNSRKRKRERERENTWLAKRCTDVNRNVVSATMFSILWIFYATQRNAMRLQSTNFQYSGSAHKI